MGEEFYGKVEICEDTTGGLARKKVRITLDPAKSGGFVKVNVLDGKGKESITLDGTMHSISIGDSTVKTAVSLDLENGGRLALGKGGSGGKHGTMVIRNKAGQDTIISDGSSGAFTLFGEDGKRLIAVRGKAEDGKSAAMWIGAATTDSPAGTQAGYVAIRNASGNNSMVLNGINNSMALRNESGENKIILDGASGDIILANADCAEYFDIADSQGIESGTVMVIEKEGKLRQSQKAYDKRVAGVISGAGNYRPGLLLDKKQSHDNRRSISLMGKVYCKVDAELNTIEIGDLLTTSSTPGHAMKATDPLKAFGAVIGKALSPLKRGKGLIPILIALQ
jgi:hypothetical protein